MIRVLLRCIAWLLLAGIAFSTLAPSELRPTTAVPADVERFAAFVLLGAAFCLGYPRHRVAIIAGVIGIAGLLEVAQHLAPGRHGHFHDVLVKASGAILGAIAAMLVA